MAAATQKRVKEYTCPSCRKRFIKEELKANKCPHCDQLLEAQQNKIDGRLATEYVSITHKHRPVDKLPIINEDADDFGSLISMPHSFPLVYLKHKSREYTVIYNSSTLAIGWIYCPECGDQKLFQNIVLRSDYLKQEHVCRKCKAKVAVIFQV